MALLPLLYVAWSDGSLHIAEIRSILTHLSDLWSLDAPSRQRLGRLLNPDDPPSESELSELLAEIRQRSAGLQPEDRRSLCALGFALAGVDEDTCREEREALAAVAAALEGGDSPATRRLLDRLVEES